MKGIVVLLLAAATMMWPATAFADNYQTQSGKVLCAVTPDSSLALVGPDAVVCQGRFEQARPGEGAVTTGDGTFYWMVGDLGESPTTNMAYGQTYHRGNWTIFHDASGTRFTNERTGHGMFVSIENVYAF